MEQTEHTDHHHHRRPPVWSLIWCDAKNNGNVWGAKKVGKAGGGLVCPFVWWWRMMLVVGCCCCCCLLLAPFAIPSGIKVKHVVGIDGDKFSDKIFAMQSSFADVHLSLMMNWIILNNDHLPIVVDGNYKKVWLSVHSVSMWTCKVIVIFKNATTCSCGSTICYLCSALVDLFASCC